MPDSMRQLLQSDLTAQTVNFPLSALEPALKRGRVTFPWRLICQWVAPRSLRLNEVMPGNTLLEIPLGVVAPLYLAHTKRAPEKEGWRDNQVFGW